MLETSNDVLDKSDVSVSSVGGVFSWMRSLVATRCATGGQQWVGIYHRMTTNTYNNQWMVVDMKLFVPGQPLQEGFFWVYEDMPEVARRWILLALHPATLLPSLLS